MPVIKIMRLLIQVLRPPGYLAFGITPQLDINTLLC